MDWTTQLIVVYPLWLDQPPVPVPLRLHLAIAVDMRAFLYRAMLQCEIRVKDLARGMTLPGFGHQHQDFIGSIASIMSEQRDCWLKMMHDTGLLAS